MATLTAEALLVLALGTGMNPEGTASSEEQPPPSKLAP